MFLRTYYGIYFLILAFLINYSLKVHTLSLTAKQKQELGIDPTSDEYNLNYAMKKQFLRYIHTGFSYNFYQKKV